MSAGLSEADPLGSGSRSCGYRPGVVCSDMADWRRFGRAPDFFGRKTKGAITKTAGCPMTRKGSRRGLSGASAQRLDHPSTLGIGGIGCNIVSGGASARGDVSRISPGIGRGQWSLPLAPPLK